MGEQPTLAAVIANDLAIKCGEDVRAVLERAYPLCDSQGACLLVAISASGMALAHVAAAMFAETGKHPDRRALDAVWRDLMRPLALAATGDSTAFSAMLDQMAAKPRRIE